MDLECIKCDGMDFKVEINYDNEEITFKCCRCGQIVTAHFINNDDEYDFCYWFSWW